MIPKEITNLICKHYKLEKKIEEYIKINQWEKDSNYYIGKCPFCNSGSFLIDKFNQVYKCYKCNSEGNVIDFVKNYKNISYRKTISLLLKEANLTDSKEFKTATQNEKLSIVKREQLLEINRIALNFFKNQLGFSGAEDAKKYIYNKRQLNEDTIANFGIGYVSCGDKLYNELIKRFDPEVIKDSGLFSYKGDRVYMKFWNRIMFPITDEWNNVISFGGRVLDDSTPKYLNGPDTPLFNKRLNLFGLGQAISNSESNFLNNIIVCEGYMDVISMHQAGFTQTVASLGTALTPFQCSLIKKYTNTVYTAYDTDAPGIAATQKAIALLSKTGLKVKVLDFSPAKDPDEFIKKYGSEAMTKRIKLAVDSKKWLSANNLNS